jgi:hypothetical protein
MNFPLLKMLIKKNWLTWSVYTGVCLMYYAILVFTKEEISGFAGEYYDGADIFEIDMLTYIASVFFSSIMWTFPMIFYIFIAHKMVNKAVDNTSISTYLSSSVSRTEYAVTCAAFLLLSIAAMFVVTCSTGFFFMTAIESINTINYLNIAVSTMLCTFALAAVSFFISCVFSGNRYGFGLLIAVPVAFMMLNMLAESSDLLKFLNWFTPFGWADIPGLARGDFSLWWLADLGFTTMTGIFLYLSVLLFKRKQLSI